MVAAMTALSSPPVGSAAAVSGKDDPATRPVAGRTRPTVTTPSATPSIAFPETPERRAAITRKIQSATGLDDAVLERLVRAFYTAARQDPVIGHLFDAVQDWEAHIARIATFWSSVALMTGRYHGQPMAAHLTLPLEPQHFARWLALFEQTARANCAEPAVELLMEKARRIAQSLELGMDVHRGLLPEKRRPE
jgi:hemoglobin